VTQTVPPEQRAAIVLRKTISPLRDAALVSLIIFGCFAGSALVIYFQARKNELAHHRELIESAATRAAASLDPGLLLFDDERPPTAQESASAMARLRAIEAKESPIGRVTLLRPIGEGHVVLFDTAAPLNSPENALAADAALAPRLPAGESVLAGQVIQTATSRTLFQSDGTVKVYAPIVNEFGKAIGMATAESEPHSLADGLRAIGLAAISAIIVGAVLAGAAALAVYSSKLKSRRAAELLVRTERTNGLIVEAMGQVFYEYDAATDLISWRGNLDRLVGIPASRLPTGLDWQERIHPADREAFRAARMAMSDHEEHFSVEYRVRGGDGHFICLLDRGGRLFSGKNSAVGVILDVTASREAEQRLRDVVDAAGEYIWEVDAAGRYTYISGRVREVLGRTPEEMLGHEPFEFVPAEEVESVRETSSSLIKQSASFRDFEHRISRADGKIIWLSVNGVPSFNADGEWSGYRGAGLDITARKEVEQALIREKEAAQAAVRTKSQFLAMMSHEIRTPLNSVLGFADLLSASALDLEQREHVELIRRSGDALLILLNDILDFSRIESAALAIDIGDVDVRACLQEVMDLYRPAAAARNIALSLEVEPDVPVAIRTDKARLRQILLNLIGNAVKFTESGSVEVRTGKQADCPKGDISLRVEVRDTGIGIPSEKVGLLFNPFSQVDSSATRRFGGTGLGLAICRRLADLLGSEVGLQESTSGGSTFYLILNGGVVENFEPVAGEAEPRRVLPVRNISKPMRVLVAEDNRVNRLLVRKMLSAFGVPSEEAENGRECVAMHAARPYDVILMDVQMPVLDGFEATRLIREDEEGQPDASRVKIIALTANAMTGDRERCLNAGMDDYLSKPIRTEALASLLERCHLLVRDSGDPKNL